MNANADQSYCLAIVPARGGSKGLPGKNLLTVGDKSLVRLAVEAALDSGVCHRVICSTDSPAIAEEARRSGGDVPFLRPAELASDSAASVDVMIHAVTQIEQELGRAIDCVCLVEPTSPLRTGADIRLAMELLQAASPQADSVVSLCEVNDAHPAWLRRMDEGCVVPYFDTLAEPTRRQDLNRHPTPYRRNGAVYITRRGVLMEQRSIYGRRCLGYVMPPERSVNIDSQMDLLCARAMWQHLHGT